MTDDRGYLVCTLEDLPAYSPSDGVLGRAVFGDALMTALVEFEPDTVVETHQHHQEQMGVLLRGEMHLHVDGHVHVLRAGDAYRVRSSMPHGATIGPEGATSLEVFQPIREDYLDASLGRSSTPFT